ncbi:hypothetical protein ERJ75_000972300 [Trypanosoma vivax]|uniref:Protein kinase domain-containing protein n=1 Tax=Trypanosoma vivax (strain Y486) TaxID=1055687 RepID=G0U699_TRYVY|nr:hypothetical protein ERJ75_000972300 [Trypanosoma vivax]CCC51402.1 conserved hypothetical protein [Trypanosoma vivax Y486]
MLAKVTGKIASALNTDPLAGYELGVRKFRGGRHNLVHIQDAVEISSNRPVSVVSIEVKDVVARCASAEESQLVLDSFKAGVTLLTKLRHPAILQVVKPLVEGKTRRRFVTERISSLVSLELSCGSLSKQEKILGLLNCSKAIEFMHQSVGYLLLDFSPSAICIVEGKWKIFDLSQAVSIERADDIKCGCPLTSIAAPMLDYCSTEVVDALSPKQMEIDDLFVTGGNKSVKAPDSDVFSFVIVCAEVLSGRKAFNCGNDATLRQRQYLSVELEVSKWFSGRPLSSPRPSLSALRKDTCFVSSDVLLLTTLEEYDLLTDEQRFSTLKGIYDGLGRSAFDEAVIVRLIIPLMCREAMQESRRRYAVPILMQCCGCLSEQTFAGFLREYIIGLLRAVIAADNLSRCLDVAEVVLGKFDLLSKHFRTDDERNTILLPFLERCVDPAVDGTNVVRMAVDCISQFTQSYGNLRFSDGLPSRLIKIASSCKKKHDFFVSLLGVRAQVCLS